MVVVIVVVGMVTIMDDYPFLFVDPPWPYDERHDVVSFFHVGEYAIVFWCVIEGHDIDYDFDDQCRKKGRGDAEEGWMRERVYRRRNSENLDRGYVCIYC